MKLLVTGARGFTGKYLIEAATRQGHEVVALRADLMDPVALAQEVAACAPTAVVHLAGISFVGHANASAFYDVNVIGTCNLLDALARLTQPPTMTLLASSANIYGNCVHSPIAETQTPEPVNHYAMSKLAMEQLARTYAGQLPICIARPFNYTGVGQSASFLIPKLISHFARQAEVVELGNLHVAREFNDVRFVCDAYLRLLDSGIAGEHYNVCTGRTITLQALIALLTDITGHAIDAHVNPAFVRSNEVHTLCGSCDKLQSCIGPLAYPTLAQTLDWMITHQRAQQHTAALSL